VIAHLPPPFFQRSKRAKPFTITMPSNYIRAEIPQSKMSLWINKNGNQFFKETDKKGK